MYSRCFTYKIMKKPRYSSGFMTIKRLKSGEINVIKSKSPEITISHQLIHEYVWENVGKWYDKTAVVCFETGKFYTYGQIHKKSKILAQNLLNKFKISRGETIAVILPNVPDFPIAFLGAIQAGLLVTTINPYYTPDEIASQLEDSGAKLIITVPSLSTNVNQSLNTMKKAIPVILAETRSSENNSSHYIKLEELYRNSNRKDLPQLNTSDVAILPYSSGTTGLPKGVQLTHQNVVSNLYQMSSPDFKIHLPSEGNSQDIIPVFLPLFHIYGLVGVFLNYISKGCKLVLVPTFIATQFVKLLHHFKPTLLFAVPPVFVVILNNTKIKYEDLRSIRTIVSAAAPLGISAVEKFNSKTKGKIDILQIYGMTETSPLTLMQTPKIPNGTKIGGSGFLVPNTQSKIISIDNNSTCGLGPFQTGELLVRGPQIMKGYHNNLQATHDVMLGDWLKTGDVCYYDTDYHFFVTDRLKELIKVKGFQVAPAELEEILRGHSAILDAAVVGIPHPVQGEVPKAFVVLKPQFGINVEQIKEFVSKKVAAYKKLTGGVVIIEKIPRNRSGKILRNILKAL